MYIIIVGGGKVGYHLAKSLLTEGHELLLVEKNRERMDFICGELGSVCLLGDGCEASTLDEAGTGRADMLIAVTGDDEDNLVSCQVAKHKFNVPRTIARSSNPKNEALFTKLGIDVTVSSTNVILENIEQEVPTHPLTHLMNIRDRGLEVVEVRIPAGSRNDGVLVKNVELPTGTMISLIIRKNQKPLAPGPGTTLQAGDQIIALTPTDQEEALKTALRNERQS
jgi:trk system potassium uptake protein